MSRYTHFRYLPAGDSAVVMEVGDTIDPAIHRVIRGLMAALRQRPIFGVRECIPTYRSILICYDPAQLWYDEVVAQLAERAARLELTTLPDPRIVTIPVRYGGECGPDLEIVAEHARLTPDDVIALHTEPEYLVYMVGFTPGFCYLGGLNDRLATPRRTEPRTRVPAGSVGIAGQQTGVYPLDSPGGWQLIGRTSLRLFDPHRDPPVLIQAGDVVRFVPENHCSGAQVSQNSTLPGFETLAGFGETLADKTLLQEQQRLLTVLQSGLLTTVQDWGRYGYGDIGMPVAGVMDAYAARVGNILLGNDENAAGLEMTVLGPELEFQQPTAFVITGADMQPCLNRQTIDMWHVIQAQPGDILSFAGLRAGCRAYLAVAGGFDVPLVLGSAATYLRGQIGGYAGRALQAGDRIPIKPTHGLVYQDFRLPDAMLPVSGDLVRVVLGPQADAFTQKGIDTLLGSEYVVTHAADRMGYRLGGPAIELQGTADIISDGIALGAIQVPANGQPIVMLADHQTTGGYAKIAHVIAVDIPILAQKKPGDRVRFAAIAMPEAQRLYRERERRIARLKHAVSAHIQARCAQVTDYALIVNGQPYHVRVEEL